MHVHMCVCVYVNTQYAWPIHNIAHCAHTHRHTVKHMYTHACIHVYVCVYMATHLRSPLHATAPSTQVRILFAQSPLIAPLCPPHTHTHARLGARPASVCVSVRRVLVIASACATSLLALAVLCVFEEKKAKEQLISATLTSRRWRHTLLCCCWGEVRARSTELSVCGE